MVMGKDYHREYSKKYYRRKMDEYIKLLGGKCVKCQETSNLEFDHIDPKTKEFSIGKMKGISQTRMKAELIKCQLLCRSCHLEKTLSGKVIADIA